ncbi:Energy-coupling factor transporter transmembrane protein EcfT [Lachnospiraceae bacterium NE2001]|nr:Energy-coupling factor transporter transmembrane protein EcfT [Lachnospiraceae bacterium NE2001]
MNRRFSVLRTYDPRTKLHILLMYLVLTLATWNVPGMVVSILTAALVIFMTKESLQTVVSMSLVLLLIDIVIGVICVIAFPIVIGLYIALKLILFTYVYLLIMKSMKPGEMLDGLALGFGLRARTTKYVMIVLDFIPKVYREKRRGRKAQRARGISPDGEYSRTAYIRIGNFSFKQPDVRHVFSRIRQEALLAIPNIHYAVIRSKRQAEAMTRRQYHSTIRRSPVYELRLTAVDKVSTIIYWLLMLAGIILSIMF